eukprot:651819-Alexandrium_andersonii.AAC.1
MTCCKKDWQLSEAAEGCRASGPFSIGGASASRDSGILGGRIDEECGGGSSRLEFAHPPRIFAN